MRNYRALLTARRRLMLPALFVLGLASAAQAQGEPNKPGAAPKPNAAASKPSSVGGVTVNAQRRRPAIGVPTAKTNAFAAEAAKNEAWRKYRKSTPPLTNSPNDDSKDFPGIQIRPPQ